MAIWDATLQHTVAKRTTSVHNATSHLVKVQLWRLTFSSTLGKRSTGAHNAIIQPIELLIFEATLWRTLGKRPRSAVSATILQFIHMIWSGIKLTILGKRLRGVPNATFQAPEKVALKCTQRVLIMEGTSDVLLTWKKYLDQCNGSQYCNISRLQKHKERLALYISFR